LEATAVNGGNPSGKCIVDEFAGASYKNLEEFVSVSAIRQTSGANGRRADEEESNRIQTDR
jgi:hypothetical protein